MLPSEAAIAARLDALAREHGVRLVYACEAGSRAWGFASPGSDRDVRFVYVHPRDWYLSIDLEERRDVIELAPEEGLEISGWDLRKALQLLRKSNPQVFEWLASPIVYLDNECLRTLAPPAFSPPAFVHYYRRMAQTNLRGYLRGEEVWLKKYLYVLRPLLSIRWIESGRGTAPPVMGELVEATMPDGPAREAALGLLAAKREGSLPRRSARIEPLSRFLEAELERLEGDKPPPRGPLPPIEPFNVFFLDTLDRFSPEPASNGITGLRLNRPKSMPIQPQTGAAEETK